MKPNMSNRLRLQVMESGKRLTAAFAEGKKACGPSGDHPENGTAIKRWRNARNEVRRAVECYVVALDNYLEAVLAELPCRKPAGSQRAPVPSAGSAIVMCLPRAAHSHHRCDRLPDPCRRVRVLG